MLRCPWGGVFCLLCLALAFPASPAAGVEGEDDDGARFGLVLDLFSEHQESLRIQAFEQTVRTRDLASGVERSGTVATDPGLLNRKFDLRWDLAGAGTRPAVALPLPGALGIHSVLYVQAAAADVRLDFRDRNQPADSSSLEGRGALFGTGFDLTRSLCRRCPWRASASYFFQKLTSEGVDRSPAFRLPGFTLLEDEVRLSREVHEAATRVGYLLPGGRTFAYTGVRHRRTDLEIRDRLRYRDPPGATETALSSRTRLESEVTLAVAGIETRLRPRLFGHLETGVAEGDWAAVLGVVYLYGGRSAEARATAAKAERQERLDTETRRRLQTIAGGIAPRLSEIEVEFLAGRRSLPVVEGPDGQPAYLVRDEPCPFPPGGPDAGAAASSDAGPDSGTGATAASTGPRSDA